MAKRGTDCQESIERSTVGARVTYCTAPGNTVPYPPLFDTIRQNHGFIDTDGHPENVDQIPEVAWSAALRSLLLDLASPSSDFISLGCDLGEGKKPKRRMSTRWVAGGYVQIMVRAREEQGVPGAAQSGKWQQHLGSGLGIGACCFGERERCHVAVLMGVVSCSRFDM